MRDATALLRAYARLRLARLARLDPVAAQQRELMALLRTAQATRFGAAHGFADMRSVADYQARVRLRRYEDFWDEWWQPHFPRLRGITWPDPIPYFAYTSGTERGVTKYIPVSRAMARANRRAALDILAFHIASRPQSRILGGRQLVLGGSTKLVDLAPGIRGGDLSGIAALEVPWWARSRYFPRRDLALLADWEEKTARLAPLSLDADVRSIAGTPSWMLLFFERLGALHPERGRRLAAFYPKLELIIHGGVSFAPYRDRFAAWLADSRAETREVYPASEGFIAIADRGPGEGLRLILDNGLFLEFVPVAELDAADPTRHWIANAETGVNYALAITSNAGLWSCLLGDTVTLVGRDPPRVLVTGRIAHDLSVFGEHLTCRELDTAVAAAAHAIGAFVADYVAAATIDERDSSGRHLFIVELAAGAPGNEQAAVFARTLDAELARQNADYADHRRGDYGVRPPRVRAVPPGTFAEWMRRRGRLGGQNKVPRVIRDPDLLHDLRRFVGDA